MKKVLLVANTDWYLYNFRMSLARFLQKRGLKVVFVSPPGKYTPELISAGFEWIPWSLNRRSTYPWIEFISFVNLCKIYRSEKPDMVHHFTVKPVLYGSIAALFLQVPGVINSITGLGFLFLQNGVFTRFLRNVVKIIYQCMGTQNQLMAIFENESDRSFFLNEKMVSKDRTFLIPGVGVDIEYFLPSVKPIGKSIVVLPARLLWDKGVGVLVEAARIIRKRCEARIVLVGEPDPGNPVSIDLETIQKWIDEGIVEWWGWKSDMREVYRASTIVTLPSMGEGLPTVLIEACACGRAIVTTDVPGCRDVVEDGVNGIIVPPSDPVSLAEAIIKVLEDHDLRERMGKAGREIAVRRFSDSIILEENWNVYARVLKKSNDRGNPIA